MLKLYFITYFRHGNDSEIFHTYVLGYNPCHAVNLFYRELDLHGDLNNFTHRDCEEISCIHPAQFKKH